ncbi:MAG TPA: alpha/beta hydrolase [Ktedonobacteraceae bacterium]|nr:alpha/beta hydrolase [Ktedonobacteraceae bacterium]
MIEPRDACIDAEGIHLHYLEWDPHEILREQNAATEDSDNVPIVMLHALGATAESWRLVASELCQRHPIIAFDLRGHGQSEHPDVGYDLVTMAEDVIRGMAMLGLGQVVLVGHGWGARVALVLAARHPALLSHLILVDCPHVEPRHWPDMTRERFINETGAAKVYESRRQFIQAIRADMAAFWSTEVEQIVNAYIRDLPDGRVEEHLSNAHQRLIRAALWEDHALPYYSKLRCPVLLVPAAAEPQPDGELPERLENADEFSLAKGYMAQQVARAIQSCSVLWMPHTTHEIQFQRPKELAEAIGQFIQT